MTTPSVSLRLSPATQERLRQARQPGESQDSLITRALDALQALESPQDSPAGSTPHDALAWRLEALQASLEARIAKLEDWRASLAKLTPPGATQLQHSAIQAPATGVTQPAIQPVIQAGRTAAQDVTQPATQAYPAEVKMLALKMQDEGQPNRVIAAAILEQTGRKPDSKNMGALLRAWRKALAPV